MLFEQRRRATNAENISLNGLHHRSSFTWKEHPKNFIAGAPSLSDIP